MTNNASWFLFLSKMCMGGGGWCLPFSLLNNPWSFLVWTFMSLVTCQPWKTLPGSFLLLHLLCFLSLEPLLLVVGSLQSSVWVTQHNNGFLLWLTSCCESRSQNGCRRNMAVRSESLKKLTPAQWRESFCSSDDSTGSPACLQVCVSCGKKKISIGLSHVTSISFIGDNPSNFRPHVAYRFRALPFLGLRCLSFLVSLQIFVVLDFQGFSWVALVTF